MALHEFMGDASAQQAKRDAAAGMNASAGKV